MAVLDQSDLRVLVKQLRVLASEETGTHPWLDIALAWGTTYAGQLQVAAPLLQTAERALGTLGPLEAARAAARIAFLRSYAAINEGDACQAAALAREALALLPEDDLSMRAYTFSQLGAALLASGDLEAAGEAHAEAVALSEGSEDRHVSVMALCRFSAVRMLQGKLHSAASCCQRALDHAHHFLLRTGRHLPVEGYPLIRRAQLLYQWNHLGEALDHVRKGIELSRQWGQADILALGHFTLARVLQASSDASGALQAIQEARRIAGILSARASVSLGAWEARLQLGHQDSQAVSEWLDERVLRGDDEIGLRYLDSSCTLARVLIAQGRHGEARRLLDSLVRDASAKGAGAHVIEARVLLAITLHALGLEDRALEELEHALSLAEEERFVRIFLDEGEPMSRLLRRAVARGVVPGYAGTLLLAFESTPSHRSVPVQREPLSERELQILRLLRTRLSAREMAEELFISVNTVRSHVKTIYAKLDVHRRSDAVSYAQELGLLQR